MARVLRPSRREFLQKALSTSALLGSQDLLLGNPARADALDRWKIRKLNPTSKGSFEWYSQWDIGKDRCVLSGEWDPLDPLCQARGDGLLFDCPQHGSKPYPVRIDGKNGYVALAGPAPRLYIYDRQRPSTWTNLEFTVYHQRVKETGYNSSQGCVLGVRSTHQEVDERDKATFGRGLTQHMRVSYGGVDPSNGRHWPSRAVFQKELCHHADGGYSSNRPSERKFLSWPTPTGVSPTMRAGIWYGFKYVIRTVDGTNAWMQIYRDLQEGRDGGAWELVSEYTDDGAWKVQESCGHPPDLVLLNGGSVYLRNDDVIEARYKWASCREIEPEPSL